MESTIWDTIVAKGEELEYDDAAHPACANCKRILLWRECGDPTAILVRKGSTYDHLSLFVQSYMTGLFAIKQEKPKDAMIKIWIDKVVARIMGKIGCMINIKMFTEHDQPFQWTFWPLTCEKISKTPQMGLRDFRRSLLNDIDTRLKYIDEMAMEKLTNVDIGSRMRRMENLGTEAGYYRKLRDYLKRYGNIKDKKVPAKV